jgi:hypothetical protein
MQKHLYYRMNLYLHIQTPVPRMFYNVSTRWGAIIPCFILVPVVRVLGSILASFEFYLYLVSRP